MKFKDTYNLLKYLTKKDTLSFSIEEQMGFPCAEINGNLDETIEKHLVERIESFVYDTITLQSQIRFDGTGVIEENKSGELIFSFSVLNTAFPNHDFLDSEDNEIFVYRLSSCLYDCLRTNDMLNNPPDDDFEYEEEFESIPIDINFEIFEGKIIERQIKVLNIDEIKELDDNDIIKIITSLYNFIKKDDLGVCYFSYSEGDDMKVSFDAFYQQLDIYDIGKTELRIEDYFSDGVEFELN
jgi:hypothetical protein